MMFLIDQGERIVSVGEPEAKHCPHCEEEKDFVPQLKYSYGQFDLLFGFVYNKRYHLACSSCHHGWILDTKEMEQNLGRIPIPFHLRYGLFVLAALAITLWAAVSVYRDAT